MAEEDKASKTEEPTQKKLKEAWEKGDFAKAPEVAAVFSLAGAFSVFVFYIPSRADQLKTLGESIFGRLYAIEVSPESVIDGIRILIYEGFQFMLPMFSVICLSLVVAYGTQTGFRLSPKALEWKASRLNPAQGAKNLFSSKKYMQFGVDLTKFTIVGMVLWAVIKKIMDDPVFHSPVAPDHLGMFMYDTFIMLLLYLIIAIGAIAALHYSFQKSSKHKDLKMTRQEIKDEFKNQEGDPMMKQARRQMALRMSRKEMLGAVPGADVVITNPTHFAIVLRYEQGVDEAPRVVAKGKNRFAQQIKQKASECGVPMVENKPVARLLYKMATVGEFIPMEAYKAIAQILSQVYKTHRSYYAQLKRRREEAKRYA